MVLSSHPIARFSQLFAAVLVAILVLYGEAIAGPVNGFGIYAGVVQHSYRLPQELKAELRFKGTGIGLGADGQFVVNDRWSLNPALQASWEKTTDIFNVPENTEGTVFAYSGLFQVRFWSGGLYLAAQIGVYQETFHSHRGQVFGRGGEGGGLAAGWEGEDRLSINLQVDLETPLLGDDIRAIRAQLGYRFR